MSFSIIRADRIKKRLLPIPAGGSRASFCLRLNALFIAFSLRRGWGSCRIKYGFTPEMAGFSENRANCARFWRNKIIARFSPILFDTRLLK